MDLDIDDEKSLRCFTPGGGAVKTLAATPLQLAHNLINNTDSGVHSQQSLKSVKIEILQPEVKGGLILEDILVLLRLWQYGLWSFQKGDTQLERFLSKNQHTKRKLLNFEFWINGELSKCAKI